MQIKELFKSIKGAFHIEYAILLAFAVLCFNIYDMKEPIGKVATNESENRIMNKYAYHTVPDKEHENEAPQPPQSGGGDSGGSGDSGSGEGSVTEPEIPNIEQIEHTAQLSNGYYKQTIGSILEHKGGGNTYSLKKEGKIDLDSNKKYRIEVKNIDSKMVDESGKTYELKDYSIEFFVVYDYYENFWFEYVEQKFDFMKLSELASNNIEFNTGDKRNYYIVYNIAKYDSNGKQVSINQGPELKAVSYMLKENIVIEEIMQ